MGAENTSVLRGHDVVCISSIDWDFIWQGHQQIMSALAAHGNRVLFIENTGVRPPRFADFQRVRHRLARWWNSTKGFREEAPNLFVYSPLIVPLPYSRLARVINRWLLLRAVRGERLGPGHLPCARVGAARVSTARVGAARVGAARVGAARVGTARVGAARRLRRSRRILWHA